MRIVAILIIFLIGCRPDTIEVRLGCNESIEVVLPEGVAPVVEEDISGYGGDTIDVYFNVVLLFEGMTNTDMVMESVLEQIEWMNLMYDPYAVRFKLYEGMIYNATERYTIDEMVQSFSSRDGVFEAIASGYEVGCAVNVFVFDNGETYYGWTPTLGRNYEYYELFSPELDRIVCSVDGMERGSTLFHEFLHFTNASDDIVDMNAEQMEALGIVGYEARCRNVMNYGCYVDQVTDEQLSASVVNYLLYREYLICE